MSQLTAVRKETVKAKPPPASPEAKITQPAVMPEPTSTPTLAPAPELIIIEQGEIETPLRYCVLCRDVAVSMTALREPILYYLIVAIRARQLPVQHPLAVVTHWVLDGPAAHQVRVSVLLPESPESKSKNRETLVWSAGEINIQAPGTHYIHTFQFGELEFPVAGLYRVEVHLDGRPAGAFPLLVVQQAQVEQAAPVEGSEQEPGESDEQA